MKKSILTLVMAFLCAQLFAQTSWTSDPNHSRLGFTISHMGINEITGTFDEFTATIIGDENNLSEARIKLKATVGSVNTRVEARDKHLRSADFFDVENYPIMTFESSSVREISENNYEVKGKLSLHGLSKEVVVQMKYRGMLEDPKDPNNKTIGIQITGSISRADFRIGEKFQAPMLGDTVSVKADGEFKRK